MRIPRIAVLLVAFIMVFSTVGCKGDNYTAEKLMWKANKKLAELKGDDKDKALTKEEALELIPYYKEVVNKCPGTNLAGKSQFIVADLYVNIDQVDRAREELDKVINNFPQTPNLRAEAQFYKGYLYETHDKDWAKAKEEYEKVLNNHEGTVKSLEVPVYIAKYYEKTGDKFAAREAYDKAITYYERSMDKGISRSYVGNCMEVLSTCYAKKRRWDDALNVLKQLATEYAETPHAETAAMKITNICTKILKDSEKEKQIYSEMIPYFQEKNPMLATKSQLRLAQLNIDTKQGAQARDILTAIQDNNKQKNEFSSKLELMIAKSYLAEGNWDDAKDVYQEMGEKYPKTLASFQSPILMAQHYIEEGKADVATEILNGAIKDFKDIMEKNPNTELAAAAQDYISMSFLFQKKWEDSVESLETLVTNYPDSPRAAASQFAIGSIYQNFLKDKDRAVEAYQEFIAKYPEHQWVDLANTQIEALTKVSKVVEPSSTAPVSSIADQFLQ